MGIFYKVWLGKVLLSWWQELGGPLQHEPPFQVVLSPYIIWAPRLTPGLYWEMSSNISSKEGLCGGQGVRYEGGWHHWKIREGCIVFCFFVSILRKIISFFVGLRKTLSVTIFYLSVLLNRIWIPSTKRTHALSPLLVPFCIKLQPSFSSSDFPVNRIRDFAMKEGNIPF